MEPSSSCGAAPLSGNKGIWYTEDLGCGFVLDAIQYEHSESRENINLKGESDKWPQFSRSKCIKEHLEKRKVQCIVGGTFVTSKIGIEEFAKATGNKPTVLYSGNFSDALNIKQVEVDTILGRSSHLNIQQVGHFFRPTDQVMKKDTRGTFHPKFVLIFMEEGLAIAISTSNMTGSTSLEGTWSGFVPRVNNAQTDKEASFGVHLQNFLESCEEQRLNYHTENKIVLTEFLRENAGFELSELHSTFEFSKLNHINLISTVPGRHFHDKDCDHNSVKKAVCKECYDNYYKFVTPQSELQESCKLKNPMEYGVFRMNEVLRDHDRNQRPQSDRCSFYRSLGVESDEFLDDRKELKTDQLIVQTTSTGAKLETTFFRGFLSQLVPDIKDENSAFQKLRLVWATQHFTNGCFPMRQSSHETGEVGVDHSDFDVYKADGNVMKFMEPGALKTILHEAPGCLYQWESLLSLGDNPSDFKKLLNHIHHIKTILRPLYESNKMRQARILDDESQCTCSPLQWCLLGSSCMSIGAQGIWGPLPPICGKNECRSKFSKFLYKEHRNFELGVMFISNQNTEYRALDGNCPEHCPDAGGSWCNKYWRPRGKQNKDFYSQQTVKVLPIPYKIRCSSYHDGDRLAHWPTFCMRDRSIQWCLLHLPFTESMKEHIHPTIKFSHHGYFEEDLEEESGPVQPASQPDSSSSFNSSSLSGTKRTSEDEDQMDGPLEQVMGKLSPKKRPITVLD